MQHQSDISKELFHEIEKYISGKMTPVERANFEVSLRHDDVLKAEVDAQKVFRNAIDLHGFTHALQQRRPPVIRRIESHTEDTDPGEGPRYWFAVAASILAIIAVGIYALVKQPPINEQLFTQYATEDPGLPVPMSATDSYVFYDAMVDYKLHQYPKAIEKWNSLHANAPQNDTLNYYLGSAHFNAEQFDLAIPFFEEALASHSLVFSAKSQWYLVLSYLKTEQYSKIHRIADDALPTYRAKIWAIRDSLNQEP